MTDQQFRVETFAVGRDETGSPLCKTVANMTKAEQHVALAIAAAAYDAAHEALAPYEPMIEVGYMPETLAMGLATLDAIFAFQAAHERLMRLCDAVKAAGAH